MKLYWRLLRNFLLLLALLLGFSGCQLASSWPNSSTPEVRPTSPLQKSSPTTLPDQLLYATCQDQSQESAIYSYDLSQDEWKKEEVLGTGPHFVTYLPSGDRLVQKGTPIIWEPESLELWRKEQKIALVGGSSGLDPQGVYPLRLDPKNSQLLLNRNQIINLNECTSERCNSKVLEGIPMWSLNGQQSLITSLSEGGLPLLFLGDKQGNKGNEVGIGRSPVWLTDQQFAYVTVGNSGVELHTSVIIDPKPSILFLTINDLKKSFPAGEQPTKLIINDVAVNPQRNYLFITAGPNDYIGSPYDKGLYYIFRMERTTRIITLLFVMNAAPTTYQFSPDGTWLGLPTVGEDGGSPTLYLYDIVNQKLNTLAADYAYFSPLLWQNAWSSNGDWVAIVGRGRVQVLAPAFDYQLPIKVADTLNCTTAAWLPYP